MNRLETAAGLDIGTTKVTCVVGELGEGGRVLVTGVGAHPTGGLRRGIIVDIDGTTQAVRSAVAKAAQQCGKPVTSVVVGVTGEHIRSLNAKGVTAITNAHREIREEDRQRAVQQSMVIVIPPDRVILHAIPRSYAIDGHFGISHPVGMSGTRLEVETHIVTAGQSFLDNVKKCVERAGLLRHELVLAPIATALAALRADEREVGTCLIDIGGGTTDLAVYHEGEPYHSASLPVGGNHVSSDIAYLLRVSPEEAERLKLEPGHCRAAEISPDEAVDVHQVGSAKPRPFRRRALCDIIEARMQEVFTLALNEVQRMKCQDRIAGVVLTGGGALLSGAADIAAEVFGRPCRVSGPGGVAGLIDQVESPIYSGAVGLMLHSFVQASRTAANTSPRDSLLSGAGRWLKSIPGLFRPN